MDYQQNREIIFNQIRHERIFTWDHMYGQEYALASTYPITDNALKEITYAAEQLSSIFSKVIKTVPQANNVLLSELGIPEKAFEAVRIPIMPAWPTTIGRFDFARTEAGLKMLEFNSDTPGGIVEAYYLNGNVCEYYRYSDVNAGMTDHLTRALNEIIDEYRSLGYATDHIVFSALDWHDEDAGTARFVMNQLGLNASFTPLKNLRIFNDRLWHLSNDQLLPIDVLGRLHPLGILCDETDLDGYPTGEHLLDLIVRKKLAVINQPSALLAQTKALLALIWLLHEKQEFFTAHEHHIIETYMIPTYLENNFKGHCRYVVKPVLGREGGAVTICNTNGTVLNKDPNGNYWDQNMIYQKYVDLEEITIETLNGPYTGSLVWGAFVIGGQASAINARLGGKITDDLSYFLPIRLE